MRTGLWILAALAWALPGPAALATTDTTFAGPLGTVTGIVSGTGGQLAAALVGSVLRFNAAQEGEGKKAESASERKSESKAGFMGDQVTGP